MREARRIGKKEKEEERIVDGIDNWKNGGMKEKQNRK